MKKRFLCLIVLASIIFCDSIYALSMAAYKENLEKVSTVAAEVEVIDIAPIEINARGRTWKKHLATLKVIKLIKGKTKSPILVEYATYEDQAYNEVNLGPRTPRVVGKWIDIDPLVGKKGTIYLEEMPGPGGHFYTIDGRRGFQETE